MTRQHIGYLLTVNAVICLIMSYLLLLWLYSPASLMQMIASAALSIAPLTLFLRRTFRAETRAFAALALLAPLYFLFGGIIWLWDAPYWGAWLCLWAVILEVGTILHNYQKRQKSTKV